MGSAAANAVLSGVGADDDLDSLSPEHLENLAMLAYEEWEKIPPGGDGRTYAELSEEERGKYRESVNAAIETLKSYDVPKQTRKTNENKSKEDNLAKSYEVPGGEEQFMDDFNSLSREDQDEILREFGDLSNLFLAVPGSDTYILNQDVANRLLGSRLKDSIKALTENDEFVEDVRGVKEIKYPAKEELLRIQQRLSNLAYDRLVGESAVREKLLDLKGAKKDEFLALSPAEREKFVEETDLSFDDIWAYGKKDKPYLNVMALGAGGKYAGTDVEDLYKKLKKNEARYGNAHTGYTKEGVAEVENFVSGYKNKMIKAIREEETWGKVDAIDPNKLSLMDYRNLREYLEPAAEDTIALKSGGVKFKAPKTQMTRFRDALSDFEKNTNPKTGYLEGDANEKFTKMYEDVKKVTTPPDLSKVMDSETSKGQKIKTALYQDLDKKSVIRGGGSTGEPPTLQIYFSDIDPYFQTAVLKEFGPHTNERGIITDANVIEEFERLKMNSLQAMFAFQKEQGLESTDDVAIKMTPSIILEEFNELFS